MYVNANYLLQQHATLFENSPDFNNFIQCLNSVLKSTKFWVIDTELPALDKDKALCPHLRLF